jgi:hypothetical protein
LRGSSDHVLDKVSVARSINDGKVVLWGLKLSQGDIDGNSTFSFALEFIQNEGKFERCLAKSLSFGFQLFNGSLIDASALEDQVTSGSTFTSVNMTNDNDIDVSFVFAHRG